MIGMETRLGLPGFREGRKGVTMKISRKLPSGARVAPCLDACGGYIGLYMGLNVNSTMHTHPQNSK